MAIEFLNDWNARLKSCGCCEMPLCPAPSIEIQQVTRTLCAIRANAGEYQMGDPLPNLDPANGGVSPKEATVAYRSMRVTDSMSYSDDSGSGSDSYTVTLTKDPTTSEDNKVGIPAYFCSRTRIDGSWSSSNQSKDSDGKVTGTSEDSGSWSNALSTPFGTEPGKGISSYKSFDSDGNQIDSGSAESTRTYTGFSFAGGQSTTTLGAGGLQYEVTGDGRTLLVQFQDAYTGEMAFAAITTPEPENNAWYGPFLGATLASFKVERVDAPDNDMRVKEAVHTLGRYRWRVPFAHKGSKFKVWWDEGFFSDEWLAWKAKSDAYQTWEKDHEKWENSEDEPKPPEPIEPEVAGEEPTQPTLTEKSSIWIGPGNASNSAHATWFTEWSNAVRVPTAIEGHVEICNVRFSCYDSPFGSKPQIHEGFRIYNPDDA